MKNVHLLAATLTLAFAGVVTGSVLAAPQARHMNVIDEANGVVVATSGSHPVPPAGGVAASISYWGGPGYFWLPTEDVSGLPLANVAVQLGKVPNGHKP